MDFHQLVHACAAHHPDVTPEIVYLPILSVEPPSDRSDRVVLNLNNDDGPAPIRLEVPSPFFHFLQPYLQDFLSFASDPLGHEPPCLPVYQSGGLWYFAASQALADQPEAQPTPESGTPTTPATRPVRLQVTVTADSAARIDRRAAALGLTRSGYLLHCLSRAAISP